MHKVGIFEHVTNNHNNHTICRIQFNDPNSLNQDFFVKHKLVLFKCEVCENISKQEIILLVMKYCGTVFKIYNIYHLKNLFNIYGSCHILKLKNYEVSYSYSWRLHLQRKCFQMLFGSSLF